MVPSSGLPQNGYQYYHLSPQGKEQVKQTKKKKKYIAYFYLVKTIESSMEIRQHPCRRFISVILIESPSIPWGMICSSIVGAGLALIKTHKPEWHIVLLKEFVQGSELLSYIDKYSVENQPIWLLYKAK